MDLKSSNMYGVFRAELHAVKIWCESVNKFMCYDPDDPNDPDPETDHVALLRSCR